MNARNTRRLILLAAATVTLGAVIVLAVGLRLPVIEADSVLAAGKDDQDATSTTTSAPSDESLEESQQADVAQLQQLCGLDLRRPLYDPPQVAMSQPAAGGGPMTARLIATADEPDHSIAVFQKSDGSVEMCGQGQSFEDAGGTVTVTRIESQKVIVQYAGGVQELVVPQGQ
jgi:hypothetical protein